MTKINEAIINSLLQGVGGITNIQHCGNCMTRLRLTLINQELVDHEYLKKTPGVLGIINSDNQLQLVLGPGKVHTVAELINQRRQHSVNHPTDELHTIAANKKQTFKAKQTSSLHHFLTKFATIFTPLIPGFIAAGLLLGLATLLEQLYILNNPLPNIILVDLIGYMKIFGKGLFAFLGILIGYNAQQAFGGSGVNGAIIASLFLLTYNAKATSGIYAGIDNFFSLAIDPRGNIIGILIATIVGAWVERQIRKIIPASLDMILTSTLTLMIMGAVTFLLIMPLGGELFKGMSWLFVNLNGNPFGSALLAGLFLIAVMFGIHQGFVPVYFALVDAQGFNSLFPILAMAGAGQVGAALALFVRAKKGTTLRQQIKGAIIPGFLGIGEPLIYGVTLPRVKPFITACLGGAAGGFFIGFVAYLGLPIGLNTVFGPSGIIAIPLMTSSQGIFNGMGVYCVGLAVAYVAGFILTYLFGTKNVDLS